MAHREPVVVGRIVEIDHPRLGTPHLTLAITVLDSYAIHQQAVQCSIARDQLWPFGPSESAERLLQRLGRKLRVESRQRVTQVTRQHDLPVVIALSRGLAGSDLRAVSDLPADAFKPG